MSAIAPCPGCRRAACPKMPGRATPLARRGGCRARAVVGLDPADRRDQLPGQVAGVGGVDDGLGALVRRQGGRRDPLVEALPTASSGSPCTPGASWAGSTGSPALDRLGRARAAVGQRAVGGRRCAGRGPAARSDAHGPGGREQGQRHEGGRWRRLDRTSAIAVPPPPSPGSSRPGCFPHPQAPLQRGGTHGLREPILAVTWVTPDRCPVHDTVRHGRRRRRMWWFTGVGDNDPVTTDDRPTTDVRAPCSTGPAR